MRVGRTYPARSLSGALLIARLGTHLPVSEEGPDADGFRARPTPRSPGTHVFLGSQHWCGAGDASAAHRRLCSAGHAPDSLKQRPKKPGVLRSQLLVSAIASVRILYRSRPESQDPEIADRSAGTSGTHHRDGQIARRVRPCPGTAEPKVPERPG